MYDFVAEGAKELGFKAGDVLDVTEMENSDGWWHGSLAGKWGAFPFGYVYCNVRRRGEDFLLLPNGWAVHQAKGKKLKVGTWEPAETMLTPAGGGPPEDWSDAELL